MRGGGVGDPRAVPDGETVKHKRSPRCFGTHVVAAVTVTAAFP